MKTFMPELRVPDFFTVAHHNTAKSRSLRTLSCSRSTAETDAIYVRACIPRKARLDLIHQERRNLCMDVAIMLKTVFQRLR
jgi:lipopolysaccharide/colanic/teichoic acid biosynthesis glycosyltransferase